MPVLRISCLPAPPARVLPAETPRLRTPGSIIAGQGRNISETTCQQYGTIIADRPGPLIRPGPGRVLLGVGPVERAGPGPGAPRRRAGRAGRARAGRAPGRVRSAAAAVRVTGGHQHSDGGLVLATSLY